MQNKQEKIYRIETCFCGKEFSQKRKWHKYCSEKCKQKDYHKKHIRVSKEDYEKYFQKR